jgi:hypothetical protein
MTTATVAEREVVLCRIQPSLIMARLSSNERVMVRLAMGNGLILHSALAVDPEHGQPLGLLWQSCGIEAQTEAS